MRNRREAKNKAADVSSEGVETSEVRAMNETVSSDSETDASHGQTNMEAGETPIVLEVECGPNKAKFHLDKVQMGSKGPCVFFEDGWLTPNEFQFVSGRETAKDWKRSIKHHDKSLKLLMSRGLLSLTPPQCRCEHCVQGSPRVTEKGDDSERENVPPAAEGSPSSQPEYDSSSPNNSITGLSTEETTQQHDTPLGAKTPKAKKSKKRRRDASPKVKGKRRAKKQRRSLESSEGEKNILKLKRVEDSDEYVSSVLSSPEHPARTDKPSYEEALMAGTGQERKHLSVYDEDTDSYANDTEVEEEAEGRSQGGPPLEDKSSETPINSPVVPPGLVNSPVVPPGLVNSPEVPSGLVNSPVVPPGLVNSPEVPSDSPDSPASTPKPEHIPIAADLQTDNDEDRIRHGFQKPRDYTCSKEPVVKSPAPMEFSSSGKGTMETKNDNNEGCSSSRSRSAKEDYTKENAKPYGHKMDAAPNVHFKQDIQPNTETATMPKPASPNPECAQGNAVNLTLRRDVVDSTDKPQKGESTKEVKKPSSPREEPVNMKFSPKKESRLTNIIEQLRTYKKQLDLNTYQEGKHSPSLNDYSTPSEDQTSPTSNQSAPGHARSRSDDVTPIYREKQSSVSVSTKHRPNTTNGNPTKSNERDAYPLPTSASGGQMYSHYPFVPPRNSAHPSPGSGRDVTQTTFSNGHGAGHRHSPAIPRPSAQPSPGSGGHRDGKQPSPVIRADPQDLSKTQRPRAQPSPGSVRDLSSYQRPRAQPSPGLGRDTSTLSRGHRAENPPISRGDLSRTHRPGAQPSPGSGRERPGVQPSPGSARERPGAQPSPGSGRERPGAQPSPGSGRDLSGPNRIGAQPSPGSGRERPGALASPGSGRDFPGSQHPGAQHMSASGMDYYQLLKSHAEAIRRAEDQTSGKTTTKVPTKDAVKAPRRSEDGGSAQTKGENVSSGKKRQEDSDPSGVPALSEYGLPGSMGVPYMAYPYLHPGMIHPSAAGLPGVPSTTVSTAALASPMLYSSLYGMYPTLAGSMGAGGLAAAGLLPQTEPGQVLPKTTPSSKSDGSQDSYRASGQRHKTPDSGHKRQRVDKTNRDRSPSTKSTPVSSSRYPQSGTVDFSRKTEYAYDNSGALDLTSSLKRSGAENKLAPQTKRPRVVDYQPFKPQSVSGQLPMDARIRDSGKSESQSHPKLTNKMAAGMRAGLSSSPKSISERSVYPESVASTQTLTSPSMETMSSASLAAAMANAQAAALAHGYDAQAAALAHGYASGSPHAAAAMAAGIHPAALGLMQQHFMYPYSM